ncbi:esterase [Runella zeae]|uniref:esterase n=1 Tax=Runella zeae TaxID=94255 RepID=UPI0003F9E8EF|nr:esterase [Runella zeae]
MKIWIFVLLSLSLVSQAQINQNSPNRLVSPEINASQTVTFRLKAPHADTVLIAGWDIMSYLGKTKSGSKPFSGIPLSKNSEGIWSITLGPFEANPYQYNFVVDGVRTLDPSNGQVVITSQLPHSWFELPTKDKTAFWEARNVPHGTVHRHAYFSTITNTNRELYVYTPADYETNQRKYPVLYLLHGSGEMAHSWATIGFANYIADNAFAEGKAQPCIIVMPLGHTVSPDLPFEQRQKNNTERFEQDLFQHIMPFIVQKYRIETDRTKHAMAGLSMGGAQTSEIGINHLEIFSHIGIFSAGIPNFSTKYAFLFNNAAETNKKIRRLHESKR